jgi:hypothetical protein
VTDITDLLPQLSIRGREGATGPALLLGDVDICLDGLPLKGVQSFTLSMSGDDINRLRIDFAVRDVHIDPRFLVTLQARATVKPPVLSPRDTDYAV